MNEPSQRVPTDDEIMLKRPYEFTIGRLVMNFGALELSVIRGITELLPHLPSSALNQKLDTSFGPLLNTYSRMVRRLVKDAALLKQHDALSAHLVALKEWRNEIVHGPWMDIPGTDLDAQKAKFQRLDKVGDLLNPKKQGMIVTPGIITELLIKVSAATRSVNVHRAAVLTAIGPAPNGPGAKPQARPNRSGI